MKHDKVASPESAEKALEAQAAQIQAEIDALKADGSAAAERADQLARQREEALLAADYDKVEAIDRDRKHELAVERAARLIPEATKSLEAVRAKLKDARWATDWSAFRSELLALKGPIDAVVAGLARLDAIVERARGRGNDGRALAYMARAPRLPSGALVLDAALVRTWISAVQPESTPDLVAADRASRKPSSPPPSAPTPAPAINRQPPLAQSSKAAPPLPEPDTSMPPHRLAKVAPAPDADGKGVVLVMRPPAANSPFRRNEIIRLPYSQAVALVKGCLADFVELDSLVEPPREIANAFAPVPAGEGAS